MPLRLVPILSSPALSKCGGGGAGGHTPPPLPQTLAAARRSVGDFERSTADPLVPPLIIPPSSFNVPRGRDSDPDLDLDRGPALPHRP